MNETEQAAFDFGKKIFDLIREYQAEKRRGENPDKRALHDSLKDHTGLDDKDISRMLVKTMQSDSNRGALCEARQVLTTEELREVIWTKGKFETKIREIERSRG